MSYEEAKDEELNDFSKIEAKCKISMQNAKRMQNDPK